MGNHSSLSSSGGGGAPPTGRKVMSSKLETAHKTSVLNLADMDIKASSSVWLKIQEENLHLKIKTLDVSGNQAKSLAVEIYSMVNLKTLHASRCGIQRISDMSPLNKLAVLNLDRNDLEIDVVTRLPTTLLRLNLSFNHFSAVPPAIRPLVNVNELNLENNRIENLNGIGHLVSLVILNLDDNHICELPEEMSNLIKLRQISLKNNRISLKAASHEGPSIPSSFFTQTSIDTINLSGNPVSLQKQQLLQLEGVEVFIERRRKQKDKQFSGGVTMDTSLFGLD